MHRFTIVDNPNMKIPFTKMHGAGNDFVVLDGRGGLPPGLLDPERLKRLADRRFGVGADQILLVEQDPSGEADFVYRIFNADGGEVEQCGNGARCFARYVHDKGLTTHTHFRVRTRSGVIEPRLEPDGRVTVDMGPPRLHPQDLPFDVEGLRTMRCGDQLLYAMRTPSGPEVWVAPASMGNPHLVQWVGSLEHADLPALGPWLERHARCPQGVNAGFVQFHSPRQISLRVWERGAGETLACGTGACAAVVCGVLQGVLERNRSIEVMTRGGALSIQWSGEPQASVLLTGPAETTFEGVYWYES
ncbi:MAG: diaminopimelate epimerase [Pseudomonadota bacterium]|jgi:diaminopimelate epimerase